MLISVAGSDVSGANKTNLQNYAQCAGSVTLRCRLQAMDGKEKHSMDNKEEHDMDNTEEHVVDSHSEEKHSTGEEKNNDLSTIIVSLVLKLYTARLVSYVSSGTVV